MNVEAHFDESGTDAAELTVAGYLFEADRIDRFCDEWSAALDRHDLPYFHMVDCAHGNPPYDKISKVERVRLQMSLMRLIKRFSINGIVSNLTNVRDNAGKSYAEAVELALESVIDWADTTSFSGKIAYYLEAGAQGQGLVETNFGDVARDPARKASHRYAGHAFVPKEGNPGVQAADLLAWQYHNFTKKRAQSSLARLDLRALLRHPHQISDDCGEHPRESSTQSVEASRSRLETVFYLPRIPPPKKGTRTVFFADKDFVFIRAATSQTVLACPGCWRAICEYSPGQIRNIVFRCWCGTFVDTPPILPPFAGPFPSRDPVQTYVDQLKAAAQERQS